MVNIFRKETEINKDNYFIVDYFLESTKSLRDAAWQLAIGQSVGNPNVRNKWETEELFENHSCLVLGNEEELKSKFEGRSAYSKRISRCPYANCSWY
jgi:hypothetical protein